MAQTNKLVITDWDGVVYRYGPRASHNIMHSFLRAAESLIPDVDSQETMQLILQSWPAHGDGTTLLEQRHGVCAETLHRMAHSLISPQHWLAYEGLAKLVDGIKDNHQFAVWTHASSEMVWHNLDRVGLYGHIRRSEIYDMYDIGRKDKTVASYHAFAEQKNVDPQNMVLIEDSLKNLKMAKMAGLTTVFVGHAFPDQYGFVDHIFPTTPDAYRAASQKDFFDNDEVMSHSKARPQRALKA